LSEKKWFRANKAQQDLSVYIKI